ncbi:hypothetical protein BDV18DRAFT_157574 [Aspergillus unguis]
MAVGDAYKARVAKAEATASKSDTETEHIEALPDEKPPKRRRFKRHCARFWCCYLLGFIIFLAIFLPVFFLVIIPAIAQRIVEDTDLPIYAANLTNPKSDAVTFTLDTSLTIPLGISVRLKPFTLDLFNRDSDPQTTALTIPVPEETVKDTTEISLTSKDSAVLDEDEFVKTLTKALYSKRFTLSARGKTTGHLGALKAGITMDKDVELDGLDKLNGFTIDEAALGNVTLNLKSGSIILGTALLPDVTLVPGNNSLAFTGKLDIDSMLSNLGEIVNSQKDPLRSGLIELSASGNKTVFNGQHIPYFERPLNGLTLTARVSIINILADTVEGLMDGGFNLTDVSKDAGGLFQGVDLDSLLPADVNLNLTELREGVESALERRDWSKVDALRSVLSQDLFRE